MICGVCGGGVRGFRGTLHGRPIADWKHTDVPPGTAPHRPILGTPVDQATLDRIFRSATPTDEVAPATPSVIPPPRVAPRPAKPEELEDSQSALQILKLLELHRWELLEEPVYLVTAAEVEHLIIRARRRDLGMVVTWRRRPGKPAWELEDAFRVGRRLTLPVGSKQLKDWIGQRDERCPDCGRSSVAHEEGECP